MKSDASNPITDNSPFFNGLDEPEAFSRIDESDDTLFYSTDRFVHHLDSEALATVEHLISCLVIEKEPEILDLMAGWHSHLPRNLAPKRVTGLGLNQRELARNESLTDYVIHDLNKTTMLPFPRDRFDVVLNTVSVDYLTRPFEVFRDVGRVLKPGGLFLVIFSNRMFPPKAVKIWRECSESLRIDLVRHYFDSTPAFGSSKIYTSTTKLRPSDDKYANRTRNSDPVYAVYAEKNGAPASRPKRPNLHRASEPTNKNDELTKRKQAARKTLQCPHCGVKMKKWAVPQTPFTEWDSEFMYVCFNDQCPYLVGGWDAMSRQGNLGFSHRLVYEPQRQVFYPIAVPNLNIMKDGIMEES
jgi:SAM-dependent methyltransferase